MSMKRSTIYVDGMTCPSCEARIDAVLVSMGGVASAKARLRGGKVEVEFDDEQVSIDAMKAAIEKAGYTVRNGRNASTLIALGIGIILAAAYMIASSAGVFNGLPKVDASIGYGMLFIVGLLTSVHCVAMCGGLSLSQSVPKLQPSTGGKFERLLPGLYYNGGRVVSYTVIGGIVGALGAAFSFSPVVKGIVAGAAGVFMVLLGLKMLGVVSGLPQLSAIVPAPIRKAASRFGSSMSKRGPFAVGLLNGLMPCGPLQTMQLYALGTGSFFGGALSMFIFSVGTVPLMLAFGLAATLLPRKFLPIMVKASAVLVMFLGVVTFGRAATLAGIALPSLPSLSSSALRASGPETRILVAGSGASASASASASDGMARARVETGAQTILTEFGPNSYVPFVVQAGLPLKWTIRVKAEDLNGCNNPVVVPSYGIRKTLVPGDNLVEFTPKKEGVIAYSCWMGMIVSRIVVVSDIAKADTSAAGQGSKLSDLLNQGSGGAGGGCCSGASNPAYAGGRVPVDTIGVPVVSNGVQEITITVNGQGYSPAAIVLQKGMKAIIKFKADQLTSCNNPVVFPEYNGQLDLARGQLETPPIPITADFTFQCGMGMLHGYVKAVDNLSKVDIQKIKAEIGRYRATSAGAGCCGR